MGPCLARVVFMVCVEWQKFDFFLNFISLPTIQIFPYWRKHEACCTCLAFLLLDFFLLPSLPSGQKHSVQPSPSSQAVPWIPLSRDALSWRSKGCCQVASWMHQWGWCSAGFPIPYASETQGTWWIWALLSFSPARCLTAVSEELLFSCAFFLLTPACCSLAASLALLLPREQGQKPFALWVQTVYIYIHMLYRLFFQHPLYNRAGQTTSLGLTLAWRGIPGKRQRVISRSASNEIGCEAA